MALQRNVFANRRPERHIVFDQQDAHRREIPILLGK
jgi:hypothetical protein